MPRADVVENQLSSAIHSRLPTSNTIRARPKVLHSTVNEKTGGSCGFKGFLPVQLLLPVCGFHPEMELGPGSGV